MRTEKEIKARIAKLRENKLGFVDWDNELIAGALEWVLNETR